MSIFDFLKRKKEIDKSKEKKPERVLDIPTAKQSGVRDDKIIGTKSKKINKGFSYEVIKEPHISEKASNLGEENMYVFKVQNGAGKMEIKKAIEGIYNVSILSVNTIKIPKKKRRIGRTEGFKKGYVKAVVKVKEGQKIEIL